MTIDNIDLNDIDAGDYELVADRWDEITSEPGKPLTYVIHRRGDKVALDQSEARRLTLAGAVRPWADRDDSLAAPAALDPELRDRLVDTLREQGLDDEQIEAVVTGVTGPVDPAAADSTPPRPARGRGRAAKKAAPAKPAPNPPAPPAAPVTAEAILAEVGDHPGKALEYLEVERAKPPADQDADLMAKLEEIATTPPAGGQQGGGS